MRRGFDPRAACPAETSASRLFAIEPARMTLHETGTSMAGFARLPCQSYTAIASPRERAAPASEEQMKRNEDTQTQVCKQRDSTRQAGSF